jgi:hypothetical protein
VAAIYLAWRMANSISFVLADHCCLWLMSAVRAFGTTRDSLCAPHGGGGCACVQAPLLHAATSVYGEERQVLILTLVHSSRALIGGTTVFAVPTGDEC